MLLGLGKDQQVAFTMQRPPPMLPKNCTHHVPDRESLSLSFTRNQLHTRIKPVSCPRHSLTLPSYLVPRDLGLQLLDVTGGHRLILNLSVSSFYQLLKVLHFLLILFILYHSLLWKQTNKHMIFFLYQELCTWVCAAVCPILVLTPAYMCVQGIKKGWVKTLDDSDPQSLLSKIFCQDYSWTQSS